MFCTLKVGLTAFGDWLDAEKGPEEEGGIQGYPHVLGLDAGGSYLQGQGCWGQRWQWALEEGDQGAES